MLAMFQSCWLRSRFVSFQTSCLFTLDRPRTLVSFQGTLRAACTAGFPGCCVALPTTEARPLSDLVATVPTTLPRLRQYGARRHHLSAKRKTNWMGTFVKAC